MKKNTLIAIAILVVLAGGMAFIKFKTHLSLPQNNSSAQPKTNKLSDFLHKKQSVKCQIQGEHGEQITLYFKNGSTRVDGFLGDNQQVGHMIQTLQFMYVWNDKDKRGIKFPLSEEDKADNPYNLQDMEARWDNTQYSCHPQSLPQNTFQPPADVKFMDISVFTNPQNANNPKAMQEKLKQLQDSFGQQ